jgi:glycosyltransferase involved in cell wall biosynthesis
MEAMATQVAVVATDISGIPELVRPGETGWLVPPEQAGALAEALTEIHASPQETERRAMAGQRLVIDEFELSKNVMNLAALFEPLAS